MRVLAIDTSGVACSLALFERDNMIAHRHEAIGRGHAERLIPWIAELPGGGKADAVLVGCGPGSFTGVRVGIAAARALGLGWGVPVSGFNSLALIAAASNEDLVSVAIEGGHGELFVQTFERQGELTAGALMSLRPEIAAADNECGVILGNAAQRLVAVRGYGTASDCNPDAAFALRLPQKMRSLPPTPIYGRAPDAKPLTLV